MAATRSSATRKTTAKKTTGAKTAAKKAGAKTAAKKSTSTTSTAKRTGAKKTGAKKSATKKSAAKTSAPKKRAAKKSAPKKPTAKRSATKKRAAKKSATKKSPTKRSATKRGPARQDAIAVLEADHRQVEELFDRFEGLGDRADKTRESVVAKIIEELSVHAGIEETVFYPAVRDRLAAAEEPMVLEALEEHHLVNLTLNELQSMSAQDERFAAKVTVLREIVDHHVEEEENELFKRVRSEFSRSELDDLADELTAARSSAPTRPHPSAPDTPPGNFVANVLVAPLDAATSLTERAADAVRERIG
jgi:hemerythrin superfamily protein